MDDRLNLNDFLLKLCEKFNKENVKYLLVGGYAVILYGIPRFTEDIDFMIENSQENLTKIKKVLKEIFNDNSFEEVSCEDFNNYSVIRYGTPYNFYIDFIIKIGKIADFKKLYKNKNIKKIDNINIPIININDLYELKKSTVREIDKNDAKFLKIIIDKNKKESKNGI